MLATVRACCQQGRQVAASLPAPAPATIEDRDGARPRGERGPLSIIDSKPSEKNTPKKGVSQFKLTVKAMDPGLYRVVCRARDTTEVRGEKTPWVLRDDAGLLESTDTHHRRIDVGRFGIVDPPNAGKATQHLHAMRQWPKPRQCVLDALHRGPKGQGQQGRGSSIRERRGGGGYGSAGAGESARIGAGDIAVGTRQRECVEGVGRSQGEGDDSRRRSGAVEQTGRCLARGERLTAQRRCDQGG